MLAMDIGPLKVRFNKPNEETEQDLRLKAPIWMTTGRRAEPKVM
jgi:hypothetical protein